MPDVYIPATIRHYEIYQAFASFGHKLGHAPVYDLTTPECIHRRDVDRLPAVLPDWTPLAGHSGQHGYSGPVMHLSETLSGGLEDAVMDTAGVYVTITVDDDEEYENHLGEPYIETESVGWMILRYTPKNSH